MVSPYMRSGHRNTKKPKKTDHRLIIGFCASLAIVALVLLLIGLNKTKTDTISITKTIVEEPSPEETLLATNNNSIEESNEQSPPTLPKQINYKIKRNDTFSKILSDLEVDNSQKFEIISSLKKVFSPKYIRPGHTINVNFDKFGNANTLSYKVSPIEIYEVNKSLYGYRSEKIDIPIDVKEKRIEVTLTNSLYESLLEIGESPALISKLVGILAWDVDFVADPRKNDLISIIVEKNYVKGEFYSYGKVLAVNYDGNLIKQKAFYYESTDGYYDEEGKSLARNFLKSPVIYSRISSRFGRRRHPVTHRLHKHLGTDFAAPVGTPVWSLADGRVIKKSYQRYNGNYIAVKHKNGYTTYYLHLSKFARGLKVGQRVKQKELIGYVGTTGRSSGPHLHLSVKYNGRFINPLNLKRVKRTSLSGDQLTAYLATVPERIAMLDGKTIDEEVVGKNM